MTDINAKPTDIDKLLNIMASLRNPETGCPWDVQQSFKSITPYTIEEAYEVVDAIERNDMDDLCDELGDLLLQVVFHACIAQEQNSFSFQDVVDAICTKMIRRHPHVFGNDQERGVKPPEGFWENIKATEKKTKGEGETKSLLLDSVPTTLPALSRAKKLQSKAARVGFDWPDVEGVFDKLDEEIAELKKAITEQNQDQITEEIGDLLFTAVNLARHLKNDPEQALRSANTKFQTRFNHMENAASNKPLDNYATDQLEQLWQAAKLDLKA